jgi:4-nitrophenyl phosphatase
LDLDGVVWLGDEAIPGAAAAVARLRDKGQDVLFVSNNSTLRVADVEAKLARVGIDAAGEVVTSALAAARLVEPGERVFVCGDPGLREAMATRGAVVISDDAPEEGGDPAIDVVVVGLHRNFTWDHMRRAAVAVRRGARFIASNTDATYPTPDGPVPGAGAIVAGIAVAAGVEPVVAGKPSQPMADLVRERLGETGWMVGDRPDTDGAFAVTLGYRWALVLTGVTHESDLPVEPTPDVVAASLAAFVAEL